MKKDRKAPHEEYYSLSWFLNALQTFAYIGNLRRETALNEPWPSQVMSIKPTYQPHTNEFTVGHSFP